MLLSKGADPNLVDSVGNSAVMLAIEGVSRLAGEVPAGICAALFSVWFALEARGLLRWTLARRGYETVEVVVIVAEKPPAVLGVLRAGDVDVRFVDEGDAQ